jgi:hypothetical protein
MFTTWILYSTCFISLNLFSLHYLMKLILTSILLLKLNIHTPTCFIYSLSSIRLDTPLFIIIFTLFLLSPFYTITYFCI